VKPVLTRLLFCNVCLLTLAACAPPQEATPKPFDAAFLRLSSEEVSSLPLAVSFDAPMGSELGAFTYNAQPFRMTRHLGDDLNGIGGWNSDLGDPVYASGTGRVVYAGAPSDGWGNMVILAHRVRDPQSGKIEIFQTVYAHLDTIVVKLGETLPRGKKLGTVGTANGHYLAHLHFEIRRSLSVYPGLGYADAPLDRVSPAAFVKAHRSADSSLLLPLIE
jgi:hypothetical protein